MPKHGSVEFHRLSPVARGLAAFFAVLLLIVGTVLTCTNAAPLARELGWTGILGTITVVECHTTGEGRAARSYCTGTFTADKDAKVVPGVDLDTTLYGVGITTTARFDGLHTVSPATGRAFAATIGALGLALLFLALGILASYHALTGTTIARYRRKKQAKFALLGLLMTLVCTVIVSVVFANSLP